MSIPKPLTLHLTAEIRSVELLRLAATAADHREPDPHPYLPPHTYTRRTSQTNRISNTSTPSTVSSPERSATNRSPTPPVSPMDRLNDPFSDASFFDNEDVVSHIFPFMEPIDIPYHHLLVSFADFSKYPIFSYDHSESLIHGLYIRYGNKRFPADNFLPDMQTDMEGIYRELNVFPFYSFLGWDTFPACWESLPVELTGNLIAHPEHEFRGAKWRLYPGPSQITCTINRGTIFHIGGINSDTIRYIATICRAINKTMAVIQINAYKQSQQRIHAYDPNWPTLTMVIPRQYNNVPMPESQAKRFRLEDCHFAGTNTLYSTGLHCC